MQETAGTPSDGRQWEIDFFGLPETAELDYIFTPDYLDFRSSMKEVMRFGEARRDDDGWSYRYDPDNPHQSISRKLWREVRKNLPPYDRGRSKHPVQLYLALGCTSMDYHHGVDAFFIWRKRWVTFDISLIQKKRLHRSHRGLKAHFLITPEKIVQDRLALLGRDMAMFLKNKVEVSANSALFNHSLPLREALRTNRE